jgi:hypothetical protein
VAKNFSPKILRRIDAVLKGNHVGLRAIEKQDLETLLMWRNQPELRRYFREFRELNSTQQLIWFEKCVLDNSKTHMFSICELESQNLIGACGLCYIDWVNRSADFSIYIGAEGLYIDDKYAHDAGDLMIRYAFDELNLHRLWAEIYNFDQIKMQYFSKLGFLLEGKFRDTHWAEGKWHDSLFYSLLSTDF